VLTGCHRVPDNIEPKIDYAIQDRYLQNLPSPFPPLTDREKAQPWGQEAQIGFAFAHELDLYQAITAFKRAQILLPPQEKTRKQEFDYEILLCYYMGKRYNDVTYTFENSDLRFADPEFPAFCDLLLILYDCYTKLGRFERAEQIESLIRYYYPETEEKLILSQTLLNGDIPALETMREESPTVDTILTQYSKEKKSVSTAQWLNTVLPGAGYYYVGQKQTALTAFLLNGLFIGATYYFFHQGNIPAGIIFTSFEAGWYFGGIYGAGEEAKYYNERLYETIATPIMNREGLFPVFMIKHAF
jgi:hypothetical protein